jgi:arginyl-tRNA synthetase
LTIDLKKHSEESGLAIIRDRTGSSTYLPRDLAAVLERFRKHAFHKMIYVVAAGQHTVRFSRLFETMELMDMSDLAGKLQYVHFSEAPQMSKNAVQGHMLSEILKPYQRAMQDALKENVEKAHFLGEEEETTAALAIKPMVK